MSITDSSEKNQPVEELSSAISNFLVRADVLIKSNKQSLKDVFKSSKENDLPSIMANGVKIYYSIGREQIQETSKLFKDLVDAHTKWKISYSNPEENVSTLKAIAKGSCINLPQDNTILPLFKVTCSFGVALKSISDPIMLKFFQGVKLIQEGINSAYNSDSEKKDYELLLGILENICDKDIIDTPNLYDSKVLEITQGDQGGLSLKLFADFLSDPTSLYDVVPSGKSTSDEL